MTTTKKSAKGAKKTTPSKSVAKTPKKAEKTQSQVAQKQIQAVKTPIEKRVEINANQVPEVMETADVIRQKILFSIVLLGIFSIITGCGLIIAANWAVIPSILKVAGGLAFLATSLVTTSYFQKNEKTKWAEAFLFISFMLVGGNIALLQQSYHLSLSWEEGSMAWWILSLPLVFFAKYKLIPLCSFGLLGFSVWDFVWDMNYMLIVALMFVLMMITHFFEGPKAKFFRHLAGIIAIFFLYIGDISANSGAGIVGAVATTWFLILALNVPKTEDGTVHYYNYLFVFVAWRIFLLFWNAYYNLASIGAMLIIFGTILLTGAGLYTYYYKQIQNIIRGFVKHE